MGATWGLSVAFFGNFTDQIFRDSGAAPGADGETDGASHIFIKKGQAFIEIHIPLRDTTYQLLGGPNGIRRAGILTGFALHTKVIHMKGVRIVHNKG